MSNWYYFWVANFIVAGSAFALITLVVLVRGIQDLREMFSRLRRHRSPGDPPQRAGP